jgi:WD40 repeat protein
MTSIEFEPTAWSPDGRHLLAIGALATGSTDNQIHVLAADGRLLYSVKADTAAWVDSTTIAVVVPASSVPGPALVKLVDMSGREIATLPGSFQEDVATGQQYGAMLLGSGHGDLAILDATGSAASSWTFVTWDGHALSKARPGVPIAWSESPIAVVRPDALTGCCGSQYAEGPVELVSASDGQASATYPEVIGRRKVGGVDTLGGYDAASSFSPDGRYLVASGTVLDTHTGESWPTGSGAWLPDGTLLASQDGSINRWTGPVSSGDPRFVPAGKVLVAANAAVAVEYFADLRPELVALSGDTTVRFSIPGVQFLDRVLISPNGQTVAVIGLDARGWEVTSLVQLP